MSLGSKPGFSRQRVIIVGVTMLALSVASTCIYYSLNGSKETIKQAAKIETPLAKPPVLDNAQTAAITDVTVDPVPVPTAEEKAQVAAAPKRNAERRNKFRSSRNKVAFSFPAPPKVTKGGSIQGPNGTVEMWQGDRREFISVPPGTEAHARPLPKYEEPASKFTF
jgi:hypothetical protein